ncbi:hypothetical protein ACFE04_023088 [Oxalis oulophora]
MASSLIISIALVLLVSSCIIYPSVAIPDWTLDQICSKTPNKDSCKKILYSDWRTSSADINKLSLLTLLQIENFAFANLNLISTLRDGASYDELKSALNNCLAFYRAVADKASEAYRMSQLKMYSQISQLTDAEKLIWQCAAGVGKKLPEMNNLTYEMSLRCDMGMSVIKYITG